MEITDFRLSSTSVIFQENIHTPDFSDSDSSESDEKQPSNHAVGDCICEPSLAKQPRIDNEGEDAWKVGLYIP